MIQNPLLRMNSKFLLTAFFALVAAQFSIAQEAPFNCTTHGLQHLDRFLQGHPERLLEIEQADQRLEQETQQFASGFDARGGNAYVIPVVFHIIHEGGVENIGDDQIQDAIRVLNNDYNKLNDDWVDVKEQFLDIVADVGVTFRLAGLDPDGNCTSGITRTYSALTNDGTQDMKDLIQWPRDKYLNIWVCAYANGAAGYTQTPGNVDGFWGEAADGIVVLHNYTGSIGTSSINTSRTLTHEVGHWINLRHCWGPSNDPGLPENCDLSDNVSDTPQTEGWTSCNRNGATCGSPLDNVENYMEYAYCSKMFTNGQKARMTAALNSGTADRNNLWSESNLQATGTADPQALCAAAFTSSGTVVCAGTSVSFSDASYHNPTAWAWSFPGAVTTTSTEENPVVLYDTPGVYAVQLTASNVASTVSIDAPGYITVIPSPGAPTPYAEDFESMTALDPVEWMVLNPDADAGVFSLNTTTGFSGTHCLKMRNHGITVGREDEILGPNINLSQDSSILLSFRYAFARRTADNDDRLRVYVSNDCGLNWVLRKQLRGYIDLPTVPDQNSAFTPNSTSQWEQAFVTNISNDNLVEDFRFKFWFLGDGGSDLWIDDINVNGLSVGVEELLADAGVQALVVPNPATDEASFVVSLLNGGSTRIELMEPTGRLVQLLAQERLAPGTHQWSLPLDRLASGVYLVRVQQDGLQRVVRFTKE